MAQVFPSRLYSHVLANLTDQTSLVAHLADVPVLRNDYLGVSEGRVERTTPAVFSGDETADVGKDDATQVVAAFENVRDSHFTGSVTSVTVDTAMP